MLFTVLSILVTLYHLIVKLSQKNYALPLNKQSYILFELQVNSKALYAKHLHTRNLIKSLLIQHIDIPKNNGNDVDIQYISFDSPNLTLTIKWYNYTKKIKTNIINLGSNKLFRNELIRDLYLIDLKTLKSLTYQRKESIVAQQKNRTSIGAAPKTDINDDLSDEISILIDVIKVVKDGIEITDHADIDLVLHNVVHSNPHYIPILTPSTQKKDNESKILKTRYNIISNVDIAKTNDKLIKELKNTQEFVKDSASDDSITHNETDNIILKKPNNDDRPSIIVSDDNDDSMQCRDDETLLEYNNIY